jgi:MFS family permease
MTKRPPDPFSGLLLWAMYGSGLVVLASLCLAAAAIGTGWSWSVFAFGVLAAVLLPLANHLMLLFATRHVVKKFRPTQERQALGRREVRRRQRIYPVLFTMTLGVGILSAALETYWPVVLVLLLWLLCSVILPLALLPLMMRRVERRHAAASSP